MGKINNNDTRCLSLDADNTALAVVADTGATSNFVEMNAPCIKNIQVADPGIKVLCPDGKYLPSTDTVDLTYDKLPNDARKAHVFPALAPGSLVSIGQLCDSGCTTLLDATTTTVRYKDEVVLEGSRARWGVWNISEPSDKRINQLLNTDHVNFVVNVLCPDTTLQDIIIFLHAAFGYPVISIFCKELDNGLVLPGHLTSKQVRNI